MIQDKNTAMMKLADLLKQHEVVMEKCPEIIEIIEDLYVEIEKQQIIEAYGEGFSNGNRINFRNRNEYYNETYGN